MKMHTGNYGILPRNTIIFTICVKMHTGNYDILGINLNLLKNGPRFLSQNRWFPMVLLGFQAKRNGSIGGA